MDSARKRKDKKVQKDKQKQKKKKKKERKIKEMIFPSGPEVRKPRSSWIKALRPLLLRFGLVVALMI